MGFSDSLGSVSVEIRAKLDRYKRDMKTAVATTQKSAAKMQASMSKFAVANQGAMLGVAAAIGLATRNAVQFADQIDKVSVKTGLTRKTLQGLEFASTQLGFSFQTIETLGFRVTRRMGEAAEGNERVADAFKQAGVKLRDVNGQFRDINKVFPELLDNLSKMENEAERNALGVKIFDTEFRTLLPLLEAGAGSIKEMTDKAADLGIILEDDVLKAMVDFGDKTDILTRKLRALFIEIAGPIIGGLTGMLDLLNKLPEGTDAAAVSLAALGLVALKFGPQAAVATAAIGGLLYVVDQLADGFSKALDPTTATADALGAMAGEARNIKTEADAANEAISELAVTASKNPALFEFLKRKKAGESEASIRADFESRDMALPGEMTKKAQAAAAVETEKTFDELVNKYKEEIINPTLTIEERAKKTAQELIQADKAAADAMAENTSSARGELKSAFKQAGRYLLEGDFKSALESLAQSFTDKLQDRMMDGLFDTLFGKSGGGGSTGLLGGAGGGIFDFFSGEGFANGGNPPVGKASMVGERGPEMFVPKSAGTIIPNEALGGGQGNIVMNNSFNGDAVSRQEMAMFSAQLRQQIVQETGRRAANGGAFARQFRSA